MDDIVRNEKIMLSSADQPIRAWLRYWGPVNRKYILSFGASYLTSGADIPFQTFDYDVLKTYDEFPLELINNEKLSRVQRGG